MTLKLHRLNGRTVTVDLTEAVSISTRAEGGSAIMLAGKKAPMPVKETTEEIARLAEAKTE